MFKGFFGSGGAGCSLLCLFGEQLPAKLEPRGAASATCANNLRLWLARPRDGRGMKCATERQEWGGNWVIRCSRGGPVAKKTPLFLTLGREMCPHITAVAAKQVGLILLGRPGCKPQVAMRDLMQWFPKSRISNGIL